MRFAKFLLGLVFLALLNFSCTKQDLNEDETLTNDTEVFATGGGEEKPKSPPPTGTGG